MCVCGGVLFLRIRVDARQATICNNLKASSLIEGNPENQPKPQHCIKE